MTKTMAWILIGVAVAGIVAILAMIPLRNRSTDSQPSPHALDQSN